MQKKNSIQLRKITVRTTILDMSQRRAQKVLIYEHNRQLLLL